MCGIIGYVGSRAAKELLLSGLERLEYRGYDSAGLCLIEDEGLDFVRAVGNLDQLKAAAGPNGSVSTTGVGHTRWATHGRVSEENAHPLEGCVPGELALVLNGIVENFVELRASLSPTTTRSRRRPTPRSLPTSSNGTTRATSSRPCGPLTPTWRVTLPSSSSTAGIRACSSARGSSARWSSVSPTARPSSRRRSRPSSARPTASS